MNYHADSQQNNTYYQQWTNNIPAQPDRNNQNWQLKPAQYYAQQVLKNYEGSPVENSVNRAMNAINDTLNDQYLNYNSPNVRISVRIDLPENYYTARYYIKKHLECAGYKNVEFTLKNKYELTLVSFDIM